jgi:DNA repair protein SbcC/Rad50
MKPLLLRMQAFGPYAEVAEVDFRHLNEGGLFLIHGPTGAGKTSILDGLCYSLFGKSSGADRSAEALRCDLAKPDLATEATLEFALGQDLYRVVRRPKQTVKKLRGEGLTTQNAKGDVYKFSAEESTWKLIASGDSKADECIRELVGMTEEQFRQVVVLPQGQFRKFLSSASDEREELLQTLFRTEHFKAVMEKLQEKASALSAEIGQQRQALQAQLQSLDLTTSGALEERRLELQRECEALGSEQKSFEERFQLALDRRDHARAAFRTMSDLGNHEEKERQLQLRQTEHELIEQRLDADRRSRPVLAIDAQNLALEKDLQKLRQDKTSEESRRERTGQELEALRLRRRELDAQMPAIERDREDYHRLKEMYETARRLKSELTSQAAAHENLRKSEADRTEAELKLSACKQNLGKIQEQMKALQTAVARLDGLKAERKLLESEKAVLDDELQELSLAQDTLEKADLSSRASVEKHRSKESEAKRLRLQYHLSQAALLARELKAGEACPVCGSHEHPAPARPADTGPDRESIEAAEEELRHLADEAASCRTRLESAVSGHARCLERLRKRFVQDADPVFAAKSRLEHLERDIRDKASELIDLESKRRSFDTLVRSEAESVKVIDAAELAFKAASLARDEARSLHDAAQAKVAQLEALVPPDQRDLERITADGKAIKTRLEQFATALQQNEKLLESAVQAHAASEANIEQLSAQIAAKASQHAKASEDLQGRLKVSGFATLEDCRKAGLEPATALELEKKKRAFDDECAAVRSRLKDLRLESAALPEWALDQEAREREFQELDLERKQRDDSMASALARLKIIASVQERVVRLEEDIKAKESRFGVLGKLASVSAGSLPHNQLRVNFPRYILSARLDEVLEQASRRLFLMSRGQFVLRRLKTTEDKRRTAGLDLEVEDSHTGTSRPTASLSGGEGFLASLALALGLADVVQSRLGGVKLDAVFVDEGFGTLDPEALELAIKTLSELKAGGRIVGIISHVPELKDQIARRLHVRKTPRGSSVSWESTTFS